MISKWMKFFGLIDSRGNKVDSNHPIDTDGDVVYAKDVWLSESNMYGFSGVATDIFDNLHSVIVDSSATNPKQLFIHFNQTIVTSSIGIGADTGNYSNVKIIAYLSGGITTTVVDESASSTKYTTRTWQLPTFGLNAVMIEFHTADTVTLSNFFMPKIIGVNARLSAIKDNGDFTAIGATNNGNLRVSINEYGDTPAIDAFSRLRTSNPFTIFDSKQLHDKQPLFWDESLGGSATSTHSTTDANVAMTVTANASDFVIRQTKQRFNYQPGKSQLVFMTFQGSQTAGLTKRVGLFDGTGTNNLTPNNGIFFETDGSVDWKIAKNGTTTETASQSSWNVDKLDGTGASGITIDFDDTQILVIDFEWLGVGRVRVGFVVDGLVYYCHYFNHANNGFSSVYMSTPNLPLRYDIQTDGTTGGTIDHICSTVISEGGQQKTGILRSADTGSTHVDADAVDTIYAVVGIKLKTSYKDITVIPESFSIISETNDDFRWSVCLNPTIAGTFTYSDLTNSAVQVATGATANTVSDEGTVLASGYASTETQSASENLNTALRIGSTIGGTLDELVLCVTPLSANADIQGALNFRELL